MSSKTSFPLHDASSEGDMERVKLLLQNCPNVEAQAANGGLLLTADPKNREDKSYFVSPVKFGVNDRDDLGRTALHLAASAGNKSIVELLIRYGADINAQDKKGNTALHLAALKGKIKTIPILLDKMAAASAGDDNKITQSHLEAAANTKDYDGCTALHHAVSAGNKSIVELLIRYGADINAQDKKGNTALHELASSGNAEMVEWFIKEGASVDAKTSDGNIPLYYAVVHNHTKIVGLLFCKMAINSVTYSSNAAADLRVQQFSHYKHFTSKCLF